MLSSLLFSCVGFVLIFVVNRSNPVPGLIDFGVSYVSSLDGVLKLYSVSMCSRIILKVLLI